MLSKKIKRTLTSTLAIATIVAATGMISSASVNYSCTWQYLDSHDYSQGRTQTSASENGSRLWVAAANRNASSGKLYDKAENTAFNYASVHAQAYRPTGTYGTYGDWSYQNIEWPIP
ncbi:hypothetical protein [uncultured Robinsoniella sp.]|uniref:hypothetical protein n=1 Tax=uncultured Robinsoniella sp. TaxID=904190 RepID=UPI002913B534|nr:hypothetical protein [Clostridiales bacterium]MDU3239044.1 hypothetical protein [Clostridiales bacterium]